MEQSEKELAMKLKRAVTTGDVSATKRLLKGGVRVDSEYWFSGTLLHEAVSIGNLEIVKLILQANVKVNAADKAGTTPLHIACRAGKREIVNLLLQHKAAVNAKTIDSRTCLHIAAWKGHTEIAQDLIVAGAAINRLDGDGWAPLHWAAKLKLLELTKLLLQKGAHVNAVDKKGYTPLHQCVKHNADHNTVRVLLQGGADPNIHPKVGTTLGLLTQMKHCNADAVRLLMAADYQTHKDTWISTRRFPTSLECEKQLCAQLIDRQQNVLKLVNASRYAIRKHLNLCHGGRTLRKNVQELPLPEILQDFLVLKDELLILGDPS